MPTFDFGKQLKNRLGQDLTTVSVGLGGVEGLWNEPKDYLMPIQMGTLLELLLLYTVDRRAQQRTPPNNVLSEQDKRSRAALAFKIRDNRKIDIDESEVELLKLTITVLSTEPNWLCHQFLENPET